MRQVIGYFILSQPDGSKRVVVASQTVTTDKNNLVVSACKIFTLDTADGEEVTGCENNRFFTKKDGQLLRVIGHCISNESDLIDYHMRRRRQAPAI